MSDDLGQSVRDRLAKTESIANLVRARIYADILEEGAILPAIVVQVPTGNVVEYLNSADRSRQGLVTIQTYGSDRKEANALAKLVRDEALPANLRGQIEGIDIGEVSLVGYPAELVDEPSPGSARWRRLTQQQFAIWYAPL